MGVGEAHRMLEAARGALLAVAATNIMVIEDEPIIAMDIRQLVESCGHNVVGIASGEAEAVSMARELKPGLILADVNLGPGGDGISAVQRILQEQDTPVIFVTAYPERLLTAEQLEPAFIISKPFEPVALAIATYQAVSGGLRLD
jgi:CheY-like chemotaxis protein